MESAGSRLSASVTAALEDAYRKKSDDEVSSAIQAVLDPLYISGVDINVKSRVKVPAGDCPKKQMEGGWRTFLVKVHNQALPRDQEGEPFFVFGEINVPIQHESI